VVSRLVTVDLVDGLGERILDVLGDAQRRLAHLVYADVRVGVTEARGASAENGAARSSGDRADLALGVRVLAGDRSVASGHVGVELGAPDVPHLARRVREAIERAWRRAVASAEAKADTREKFGPLGAALADVRLHPIGRRHDTVPAVFEVDPRSLSLADLASYATDVSRQVSALDASVRHSYVGVVSQLSRELFASTDGTLIDQAFALTEGTCSAVAVAAGASQELWDAMGHQRGWEIMLRGMDEPALAFPPFVEFALALGRDAVELARAPALPTPDGDVVVVTDPHYNTLLSHEIIGHPVELDRALKMETGYAGRSWLLRDLRAHQVGRQVASPLVTAYSDPALPGFGHYRYDAEGAPGRRVVHIDRGIFAGFMNSRQTAAVFGGEPNGHYTAVGSALVPLVRMSTTVFGGGARDPRDILREVDRGYYVVGHRIPSIAESRENFRISARKVYEIRGGELGRLFRDGGVAADSRDYLMNVDAVGSDFRVYPIPNCGKGQPMQIKRLGNGGPTMRSRARVVGG
jgi:TldD protein